ncbi:MAG: GNAT family N-acetyltransferase [Armatimonadetes bacterium]|nr:GNAT family N-acetyltransferase [Candidatus Hippobium faecium]
MDYVVNLVNMFEDKDSPFLKQIFELPGGIIIRRAEANEKHNILTMVAQNCPPCWADELEPAFSKTPVTCIIATSKEGDVLGFAGIDGLRRGFFGPTATLPEVRGKGVGRAILIESMRVLYNLGFPYGIIGGVAPTAEEFYKKVLGKYGSFIPTSIPGIYRNPMKENNNSIYMDFYVKNDKEVKFNV